MKTKSTADNVPGSMQLIGQDMHIMNPELLRAVQQRDAAALSRMAERQVAAGAHALDLNLGPARQSNRELGWAVETLQNVVDVPLFIASHVLAQPDVFAGHRGTVIVNSVTADPASLAVDMARAGKYGAGLVVLLVRPGLTPFTADERLLLAAEVLETADRTDFPLEKLYLDPLFHLRPDPMTWQLSRGMPDIDSVLETLQLLPQLAGQEVRSLVALSSASQFLPPSERPGLHRRLLPMLAAAGLNAVILNCHESRLMEIGAHPNQNEEGDFQPLPQAKRDNTAALLW